MRVPRINKKTFIIIPAYNEARVIQAVVGELLTLEYEIIVVDDGSTDQTGEVCQSLPIHYLRHAFNLGQGAALVTGMEWAKKLGAEYVIHFDADGQHQPDSLETLMAPLLTGEADIVMGSRFLTKEDAQAVPPERRRLLKLARWINFLLTGIRLSDAHNGLRALNKKALHAIELRESGRAHASEILQQIRTRKLRWKEVPVKVLYTEYSQKKGTSFWDGFQVLGDMIMAKIS